MIPKNNINKYLIFFLKKGTKNVPYCKLIKKIKIILKIKTSN